MAKDAQTHDHGWSFYSHILIGSVVSTEYEVSMEAGSHSIHRIPNLRARKAGETLQCIQRNINLRALSERILSSGEAYGLTPNRLHRVAASPTAGAVTLVLQSDHIQPYSHVALPRGQLIVDPYPKKKFSTAAFIKRLIYLRQQLFDVQTKEGREGVDAPTSG
jgi:hypothetical protein